MKPVIFGLLGGIFAWVWIGATIATAYFLYWAVASDAPWSNSIWSAGISFIAKCLSVAFHDHKQRADYVDQLMVRGHTHSAATEAWKITNEGGTNLLLNLQQTETVVGSDSEKN